MNYILHFINLHFIQYKLQDTFFFFFILIYKKLLISNFLNLKTKLNKIKYKK